MKQEMAVINSKDNDFNFDIEKLLAELKDENNFLTELVDSIPANMYLEQNIQEKITANKHSTMDKVAKDLKRGFSYVPEISAKNKHKRARLDPSLQKSVSEIQQELAKQKRKRHRKPKGILVPSASLTRAANVEELQKRLQERIEILQSKRVSCRKNPEQRKRIENKVKKLKIKQQKNKVKAKEPPTKTVNSLPKNNTSVTSNLNSKPLYNKEGKVIFSKLDFSENGIVDDTKVKTGKNYKKLLKKAEKKREEIQNLKNANPEKAEHVIEKEKWKKVIQKSEGIKIKDDPTLLKKSLKKEEKKKKKSSKLWKERTEHTEIKKKTRQEKRAKNIQARKQEKLDHKIKRAKKKGRVIPGF